MIQAALSSDGGGKPPKKTVTAPYTGSSVTNQSSNTVSRQFGMQTAAPAPTPVKTTPVVKPEPPKVETPSFLDKVLAIPAQYANQVVGGVVRGLAGTAGVPTPPTPKLETKEAANITKTVAGELSGIAPAKRVLSGTTSPFMGSQFAGTALDVASAIPFIGVPGKLAATSGALGKTAKEVGAIQAAGEAAKVAKASAAGKAGALGAATLIATAPAGAVADVAKPITKITQSIDAAKGVKTAVKDVTESKVPRGAVKADVEDVTFTPKSATKVAPGTKTDIGTKVTGAAIDTSAIAGISNQFKDTVNNVNNPDIKDIKTPEVNTIKTPDITSVKTPDVTNVNNVNNVNSVFKGKAPFEKDIETKTDVTDVKDVKDVKDFENPDVTPFVNPIIDPEINPFVNPVERENTSTTANETDGGNKPAKEPTPKPKPKPKIPVKLPSSEVEELNRKRKWRPSSIV